MQVDSVNCKYWGVKQLLSWTSSQFTVYCNRNPNSCCECVQPCLNWAELWFGHLLFALRVRILKKDQRTDRSRKEEQLHRWKKKTDSASPQSQSYVWRESMDHEFLYMKCLSAVWQVRERKKNERTHLHIIRFLSTFLHLISLPLAPGRGRRNRLTGRHPLKPKLSPSWGAEYVCSVAHVQQRAHIHTP